MTTITVRTEGLRKRYGGTVALDGLDLEVTAGTVCGLLGPNGAGKTTAVRILATLLRPDGGRAEVDGLDVVAQARQVRERIGLVGQHAAVDEILGGRQNLVLFSRLHGLPRPAAARRADELLERFGLEEAAGQPAAQYSGGMRRRLDLAASLILSPPVLFLDEPTAGLDPRGRTEVWDAVRGLVAGGTTVLLTTQYLEEADQLADRVAVVDRGRVIAHDTPDGLKTALGGDRVDVVLHAAADLPAAAALVGRVTGADPETDHDRRRLSAPLPRPQPGPDPRRLPDRVAALTESLRALEAAGIAVEDATLRRPTLDEVFLHLTREEVAA